MLKGRALSLVKLMFLSKMLYVGIRHEENLRKWALVESCFQGKHRAGFRTSFRRFVFGRVSLKEEGKRWYELGVTLGTEKSVQLGY